MKRESKKTYYGEYMSNTHILMDHERQLYTYNSKKIGEIFYRNNYMSIFYSLYISQVNGGSNVDKTLYHYCHLLH